MLCYSAPLNLKLRKFFGRTEMASGEIDPPIDDISNFDNPLNFRKGSGKNLRGDTIIYSLHVNEDKTEYTCFNQRGDISTLYSRSLKLVDKFTNLKGGISSTENGINTQLAKAWRAIDRLSVIWIIRPIR